MYVVLFNRATAAVVAAPILKRPRSCVALYTRQHENAKDPNFKHFYKKKYSFHSNDFLFMNSPKLDNYDAVYRMSKFHLVQNL